MRARIRKYLSRVAPLSLLLIVGIPSLASADASTECTYPYGDGNFPTLGCCGGEDERLCVQDAWWNFSDAPELCAPGLISSDFFTCARPRKVGESCGPLAPCGDVIDSSGESISLSCFPFVQECMPASGDVDEEIFPPELCESFRSQPFQSLASEAQVAMNYGLAQSASAGVSESFEVGTVYAPDGRYGCYLTQCFGGGFDLSVGIAACAGITNSFESFPGDSEVVTLGVSTPFVNVGGSTTNTIPLGAGTSGCFDLSLGPSPGALLYYDCVTFVDLVGAFDPETGDRIPTPPPPRYYLSVNIEGTGTGTVVRDSEACTGLPGCGHGTVVELTAVADDNGSEFTGWSGYLCEGSDETCTVEVTDNMRVTAIFTNTPRYVTVAKEGTGYCAVHLRERVFWTNSVTCIFEASLDDTPTGPTNGETRVFARDGEPAGSSCVIPVFPDENDVSEYSVLNGIPCAVGVFPPVCGGELWDENWQHKLAFDELEVDQAKQTIFTGWGGAGSSGTLINWEPEASEFKLLGIKGSFVGEESPVVVVRCEQESAVDLRIVGRRTPKANTFGWNNGQVQVAFDCLNSAIELEPGDSPEPVVLSGEGGGQSVTGVCADKFGFTAEETISDINIDLTPPTVEMPPDQTLPQSGPGGTSVYFATVVSDALSGVDGGLDCSFGSKETMLFPAISGMNFPPGLTTVNCKASDRAGNIVLGSFNITVVDETPPNFNLPPPIFVDATNALGAAVPYTVSADDGEGYTESGVLQTIEVIPVCSPESGSVFPIGSSVVSCSATDRAGNTTNGEFSVTVRNAMALSKDDCKETGWEWHVRSNGEPFKNPGDCIQYVNTGN